MRILIIVVMLIFSLTACDPGTFSDLPYMMKVAIVGGPLALIFWIIRESKKNKDDDDSDPPKQ